jgi:predicted metal-binding protein
MLKVGMFRCLQTESMCPGTTDFKVASKGLGAFQETGPVEIVGFVSCGGCPGKNAVPRAKEMVTRGAETIVFVSCISKGNPIGYPCPHFDSIKDAVIRAVGPEIKIIDYSH